MIDPTSKSAKEVETKEIVSADEVLELDDVHDTRGGPGAIGDGMGGLIV